jgi:hypothetical protein
LNQRELELHAEEVGNRYFREVMQSQDRDIVGFAWVQAYSNELTVEQKKQLKTFGFERTKWSGRSLYWKPFRAWGTGQSLTPKEKTNQAAAGILREMGLPVTAHSRLD